MRCLVTGGTGFVGSHIVEKGLQKGWDLICLVRDVAAIKHLSEMRVTLWDVENLETRLINSPQVDVVIHVAGATRALNYGEYFDANVGFTRWLIESLIKSGACNNLSRFVLVSSQAAAGPSISDFEPVSEEETPHPLSDYGRSKMEGEKVALFFRDQLPLTIIRPPTVFGPRDMDVLGVFQSARFRITPVVAGPDRLVSIIYVEDLADGILTAAASSEIPSGEIFFLANEKPVVWREFAELIGRSMGYNPFVIPLPVSIMRLIGKGGDMIGKLTGKPALIRSEKIMEMEQLAWVCSSEKAKRQLSWVSKTPLEDAINKTRDWYKRMGWI